MNPLLILLILFVGTPLLELYVMIEVGSRIGALSTIGFTLLTAVIGGYLVRMQGLATAMRVNQSISRGEIPAIEMIEGAILLLCGLMLLLPGFLTDLLGFFLLIPPFRRLLIINRLKNSGIMKVNAVQTGKSIDRIIDGQYEEILPQERTSSDGDKFKDEK